MVRITVEAYMRNHLGRGRLTGKVCTAAGGSKTGLETNWCRPGDAPTSKDVGAVISVGFGRACG
jgi:hypothetical protein